MVTALVGVSQSFIELSVIIVLVNDEEISVSQCSEPVSTHNALLCLLIHWQTQAQQRAPCVCVYL